MHAPRGRVAVLKISVADFFSSNFWAVFDPVFGPENSD